MKRKAEEQVKLQERRKMFRKQHKERLAQTKTQIKRWIKQGMELKMMEVVEKPENIDMENFVGSEEELEWTVERLFANDGPDFDPRGQVFMLNCRGIYYIDWFSTRQVLVNRQVWVPGLSSATRKDTPEDRKSLSRAYIFAARCRNNVGWCRSEYAWEADAWSQAFGLIREDHCLAINKRIYLDYDVPKADEISCKLTGEYVVKERIPDAVFGMATYTDNDAELQCWTYNLYRTLLEHVLLRPKYGLAADAKRDDSIGLAFSFMVYEAKGWRGDCREARRQECSAAAFHLDILGRLARVPGPVDAPRIY